MPQKQNTCTCFSGSIKFKTNGETLAHLMSKTREQTKRCALLTFPKSYENSLRFSVLKTHSKRTPSDSEHQCLTVVIFLVQKHDSCIHMDNQNNSIGFMRLRIIPGMWRHNMRRHDCNGISSTF